MKIYVIFKIFGKSRCELLQYLWTTERTKIRIFFYNNSIFNSQFIKTPIIYGSEYKTNVIICNINIHANNVKYLKQNKQIC